MPELLLWPQLYIGKTMLIYGKSFADQIQARLINAWQPFSTRYRQPKLSIIQIGDDPASTIYVRNKLKSCEDCGFKAEHHHLSIDTKQASVTKLISSLNADTSVDGIILQLPLPKHLPTQELLSQIAPSKDVDAITPYHLGRLASQQPDLIPCTAQATLYMLESIEPDLTGMHAVIIGASTIVGKPIALSLLHKNATVTICHKATQNLLSIVEKADIIISACGKPGIIPINKLPKHSIVIDIGITRVGQKICGDIYSSASKPCVRAITPVPAGVGPVTVACLLENLFQLYRRHIGIV